MCHECHKKIETKVCKVCGEEKLVREFNNHGINNGKIIYDAKCKVCQWFSKRDIKYNDINWTIQNDYYIVDCILNSKRTINEIASDLNKDLTNICIRIKDVLKLNGKLKLTVVLMCSNCNKSFNTTPFDVIRGQICCCKSCSDNYKKGINYHKIIGIGNCKICNKEIYIYDNVPNQKYCSDLCKSRDKDVQWIYTNCANCNKKIHKPKSSIRKYKNSFCSLECELEFKHKQQWEFRKCAICEEEFECLKSSTQKMCSIQCQGKWQAINLSGENANGYNHDVSYEERTKICEWCGNDFQVRPFEIVNNSKRFCSKECRQEWHKEIWCQQEENKQAMRERAVYILENGLVSQTQSKPQLIINKLLDKMNIKYINEKAFGYSVVDNYLSNYNLIIEVMGTYWHCDSRKYSKINYDIQVNRIKMDKVKHTTILNNYNIQILYLWEDDIYKYPDLCLNLIKEYVNNKGILQNYHSINYIYNNNLYLNSNIIIPYMDWEFDDLKAIIDTSVREKMSHKQIDKWTTYNCELCGREKEQLTSHYIKQEHHYCSRECSVDARKNRITVNCNNCKNEISVTKHKYKTNKRHFCNQKCQHEYQRDIGFKLDRSDVNINIS